MSLYKDAAICGSVLDDNSLSWIYRQLLGRDIRIGVCNPFLSILLILYFHNRRSEIVLLIVWIYILIPVKELEYGIHSTVLRRALLVKHLRRVYLS